MCNTRSEQPGLELDYTPLHKPLENGAVNRAFDTVFFDVGSTLVELAPSWVGIYHRVFQRAGLDLPLGEVEQAVTSSWEIVGQQDPLAEYERSLEANRRWQREVEHRVMAKLNIHPDVQEELFWQIIAAFEDSNSYALYPEVPGVLKRLKAEGYRLGIISNWSWHLPELCQQLGIADYFEYIATSARVGYPKPRRQIFELALHELKADPARSLHIGDTYVADVTGAWSVGMAALWLVRPGEVLRSVPQQPLTELQQTIQIQNLDGIWAFLEKGVPRGAAHNLDKLGMEQNEL